MLIKLNITAEIELMTGMHIGGSKEFSAIGAVDSPITRDSLSNLPYIPGSSLKGKLRYLLSRKYNNRLVESFNDDGEEILRLFGSTQKDENGSIISSRIQVSDMILSNSNDLESKGISITEVKFENSIDRKTAVANPRQIERSIRGSKFPLDIIYTCSNIDDVYRDLQLLKEGLDLLEYDYIGGHGSRGYGRLKISNYNITPLFGELEVERFDELLNLYKGV